MIRYLFLFTCIVLNGTFCCSQITIEQVVFEGVEKNSESFLTNLIESQVGNVLDSLQIQKDIQFLTQLNGIAKVEYQVIENSNSSCNLIYTLTENKSLLPILSLWTTKDVAAIRVGITEYNLLGKNISLGAFYQNNVYNSFALFFGAPYLLGKRYGFEGSYQSLSTSEPVFFENETAIYKYQNNAFELLGNYQYNAYHKFKLGGGVFNETYTFKEGNETSNFPVEVKKDKYQFKFNYLFSKIKYNYYLLDGLKSQLNVQNVWTQNEFNAPFFIGWNDFTYYKLLGRNTNIASRLRLGFATNNESPFSPFSVDNNINIRGVGNLIDRGTATFVFNTEFRKTLYEKNWFVLQGNAFVDSGTWRNPGGSFSDFGKTENIRIYPGLGLRFIHKTIFNAIFRIDYGYGITPNANKGFVFGVGQYF